jgi:hypothetical protein
MQGLPPLLPTPFNKCKKKQEANAFWQLQGSASITTMNLGSWQFGVDVEEAGKFSTLTN